jgi:Ion channel
MPAANPPEAAPERGRRTRLAVRLWRRSRQPDAYGVVLVAVLLALIGTGIGGPATVGAVVLQAFALIFAIRTARYGPAVTRAVLPLVVLAVATQAVGTWSGVRILRALGEGLTTLLVVTTIVLVLYRIGRHPKVTMATVMGALSAYLMVGVGYAHGYAVAGTFSNGLFFTTGQPAQAVDYLYFSLVTLTTVGYGDFVAREDLGRMIAASEAVIGQLYLVTVVAMTVAHLGQQRRARTPGDNPQDTERPGPLPR